MSKEHIVELLNSEIERLTRARDLLVSGNRFGSRSTNSPFRTIRRRRPMSAETKRKISEMMRKRWEQRRRGR